MLKVLLIEDNALIIDMTVAQFEGIAEVVVAKSLDEAYLAIDDAETNRERFDGAIVDGYLERDELSIPLVPMLKSHVKGGPLVANSSDTEVTRKLVAAGCTHASPEKYAAARLLKDLLLKKQ